MKYYLPKDTFSILLDNKHYACVNPYARKTVSVISLKAKNILDFCKTGKTEKECYQQFSNIPEKTAKGIISELFKAELLFSTPAPILEFGFGNTLAVWVHVTNRCNLRCRYCYLEKTTEDMTSKTAKQLVDSCFRSAIKHNKKLIKFKLSGGEAILNFSIIEQIVKYARAKGEKTGIRTEFVILSNGTAITDTMLNWIKKQNIRIMISLDGIGKYNDKQRIFPDGSGSFNSIERTIKSIQKMKIPFNVSTTISNENAKGLPELMEYLLKNNIRFSLNLYRENDCSEPDSALGFADKKIIDYLKKTFKVIEKNIPNMCLLKVLSDRADLSTPHNATCAVGRNCLVFDHKGKVAKCQMDIKNTVSSAERADPLGDVINDKKGIQNLTVNRKTPCSKCVWRHYCCGGCALLTHRIKGKYNVSSPNCKLYKAILPEIVRLEGLRLLRYGG